MTISDVSRYGAGDATGAPEIRPDLDETRKFFAALGIPPDERICFQWFDDQKKGRVIPGHETGTLDNLARELITLNRSGAGIYWTVNETDGGGRKAENVKRVRAVFVDLDGSPLQPVLDAGLPPHVVVESSPRRFHAYWLVSDVSLDQFEPIQIALAAKFNGDPSIKDLPRVMRLPGFYHQKTDEPFRSYVMEVPNA